MTKQKKQVWVTTPDNPYDPFTQWDQWYRYDERAGYHTCEHLAYLARVSNDLTDAEYEDLLNAAILQLVSWYDPYEVYVLAVEGETQRFGS